MVMAELTIQGNWDQIKMKIKRKYRDLSDEVLNFQPGNEEQLIQNLMQAIRKDRKYVEFMLRKMTYNSESNRL